MSNVSYDAQVVTCGPPGIADVTTGRPGPRLLRGVVEAHRDSFNEPGQDITTYVIKYIPPHGKITRERRVLIIETGEWLTGITFVPREENR